MSPPKPSSGGFNLFHWVGKHWGTIMTYASYAEIGLGVAALFTPAGWIVVLGVALSVATTTTSCATGKDVACGLGIASLGLSGASYGLGKLATQWQTLSDLAATQKGFKPFVRSIGWGVASGLAKAGGYSTSVYGIIVTGVSSLPCSYIQSEGC